MVSTRLKVLLAVLGAVVLCVGAFQAYFYLGGGEGSASPEQLAQEALSGSTVEDRAKAAVGLENCGYKAHEELRRVLQESDTAEVRAACIRGLGAIEDYDSMELMMDLLEDESLIVRGTAGSAVTSMLVMASGVQTRFKADGTEEERRQAAETLREEWEQLRESPLLNRYRRKLQKDRENAN
jgi:HEAT repeat protein